MAEYIDKKWLKRRVMPIPVYNFVEGKVLGTAVPDPESLRNYIKEAPTIDITFCGDCVHRAEPKCQGKSVADFCSYGERKTDGESS